MRRSFYVWMALFLCLEFSAATGCGKTQSATEEKKGVVQTLDIQTDDSSEVGDDPDKAEEPEINGPDQD